MERNGLGRGDLGASMDFYFRGQGETPSAVLCLAKWWLCLQLALFPSAAWRAVEAELGEVAMCPDGRGSRNPQKKAGATRI